MTVKVHELEKNFSRYLFKEGATILSEQLKCEDSVSSLFKLIQGRKLTEAEAKYYLETRNNFLIEMFIRFVKEIKPALSSIAYQNLSVLQKLLWQKPISPNDYDERIRAQSFQFQIDNYYQPKAEWARRRIEAVLEILKPMPEEFILDIGCGVGAFAYHVAKIGAKSIGIDYSKESIRVARRLTAEFKLNKKAKFVISDGTKLPFRNLCFDKIIASDFIEHIGYKDKIMLIEEIYRTLRDNGCALISTPNGFRESLGYIKRRLVSLLNRKPVVETRLHFGLTNRFEFEGLLRQKGFFLKRYYTDESRPILARLPFLKELLSVHILWKVWK